MSFLQELSRSTIKKKLQAAIGQNFSQCQEVYCQVISTPAQTRRTLPFASSSELSSSSRHGRPSMKDTVDATLACYSTQIEFERSEVQELQEAKASLQQEVIQAQEKCRELERENTRLDSERRRLYELKQNESIIYQKKDLNHAS